MSIRIRTLASGSSGNATFLRFGETRILIDAGIAYARIRDGLASMGESIEELSALLITHEHTDHIKGVDLLARQHPTMSIYATAGTARACKERPWAARVNPIKGGVAWDLGELHILPIPISHDAKEPVGLRFEVPGFTLGFMTDLGIVTRPVLEALADCQALVIEANYDDQMLAWSPYPAFLKKRISGRGGHLSNAQCADLLRKVAGPTLETVILGHLSDKNNTPERALAAARDVLGARKGVRVLAALRHEPGPVLSFTPGKVDAEVASQVAKQGVLPF